jgi:hypothetical protein
MRAVLEGFAGVAPRSVVPNLIEILGTLLTRASDVNLAGGASQWMKEILLSVSHVQLESNFTIDRMPSG